MITKTFTGITSMCMHLLLVAYAIWTKIAIMGNSTALEMDKTGYLIPSTLSCTDIDYHVANSLSARTKSHKQKKFVQLI